MFIRIIYSFVAEQPGTWSPPYPTEFRRGPGLQVVIYHFLLAGSKCHAGFQVCRNLDFDAQANRHVVLDADAAAALGSARNEDGKSFYKTYELLSQRLNASS